MDAFVRYHFGSWLSLSLWLLAGLDVFGLGVWLAFLEAAGVFR